MCLPPSSAGTSAYPLIHNHHLLLEVTLNIPPQGHSSILNWRTAPHFPNTENCLTVWDCNQLESWGHSCLIHLCLPSIWYTVLISVPITGLQTHPGALQYFSTVLSCCLNALLLRFLSNYFYFYSPWKGSLPWSLYVVPFFLRRYRKWFSQKAKTLRNISSASPLTTLLLFSHSVVSSCLKPHGLQHTMLLCPSLYPGAFSNSCPLSQWCHPTISSSVAPFSCLQSFPASGSFPISQFFASGGQSIGSSASASVLPMNTHSTDHKGYQTSVTVFPTHSKWSSAGVWWSLVLFIRLQLISLLGKLDVGSRAPCTPFPRSLLRYLHKQTPEWLIQAFQPPRLSPTVTVTVILTILHTPGYRIISLIISISIYWKLPKQGIGIDDEESAIQTNQPRKQVWIHGLLCCHGLV